MGLKANDGFYTTKTKKKKRKKKEEIDGCVKQGALTLKTKIRIKWTRKQARLIQETPNSRIRVYSFTL